jgi:tRNA threonylcarbamoyladenosine biosynthesis protein TsaB
MKILALETSTMLGGIALMDEFSGLIAEVRLNVKATHSERLMTEVDHLLKSADLKIADIDVFAIAIGPGSFTGLRIGLSTVKGFSYATNNPIVSVPTLEALAWNFPYSRFPVCTLLDARKKEVYAALFIWEDDGFLRALDESSMKIHSLLEHLNSRFHNKKEERNLEDMTSDKIIFTGEGAVLYMEKIIQILGDNASFASPEKMVPSPGNVAYLGMRKAQKGEFSDPVSLVPFYIRRSEAEIKWDSKANNP